MIRFSIRSIIQEFNEHHDILLKTINYPTLKIILLKTMSKLVEATSRLLRNVDSTLLELSKCAHNSVEFMLSFVSNTSKRTLKNWAENAGDEVERFEANCDNLKLQKYEYWDVGPPAAEKGVGL